MYIYSDVTANLLYVETAERCEQFEITDINGNVINCQFLYSVKTEKGFKAVIDASGLEKWSLDNPALYFISDGIERVRFGHSTLRTFQGSKVLFNEEPIFLRGYIRGIIAHDHPNMTGESDFEAAKKNISQAKKYGFNLVRFHSTIPSEDFVNAADELGLLVHMEIGFEYETDEEGNKRVTANNSTWTDTILKYRNHPSVAIFCIGNEMHNAGHYPEVRALYDEGKALAPTKLVLDNTGWGEFDRTSADIFNQHIAYYFPYKHHREMFKTDDCWMINGSVSDEPMNLETKATGAKAKVHRYAIPIRPTLSHEAVHYIDIPDYQALCDKYDAFAKRVGAEYLEKHGIKKPRFMSELLELIDRKNLKDYMPDYIKGSRRFKEMGTKTFIENLRLSQLCGFEMLQFSDCLKYENKNGIVDCFDDDKGIDPAWFRQMNSDLVVLIDKEKETWFEDETVSFKIYVSNFEAAKDIKGNLEVFIDGERIYYGKEFVLAGGLQEMVKLDVSFDAKGVAAAREIKAVFTYGEKTAVNSWNIWTYPHNKPVTKPECDIENEKLAAFINGDEKSELYMTDRFDDKVIDRLSEGKTVLLMYEYGAKRNKWQMTGALERFKPCIWDRGSNLGGFINSKELCGQLAVDRYFDLNMQKLLEAGTKVNLDHFPCSVNEIVCGIDKPVRDRMQGLVTGNKSFMDDDMLRRFSHLFSFKVGDGQLIICTFNVNDVDDPTVQNLLSMLIDRSDLFTTEKGIGTEEFVKWLDELNAKGFKNEDIMNRFWEQDNKPVEDVLFWEEHGINLADLV
ncbi:MAG: glycoside hydrolase family 2 TIM barrel-domain containing protein [Eubacteriales bacterium]|nr:glycoside hydrolase family 2 TIM barrel-domain containing protein [Eubacteriales bacterium]